MEPNTKYLYGKLNDPRRLHLMNSCINYALILYSGEMKVQRLRRLLFWKSIIHSFKSTDCAVSAYHSYIVMLVGIFFVVEGYVPLNPLRARAA